MGPVAVLERQRQSCRQHQQAARAGQKTYDRRHKDKEDAMAKQKEAQLIIAPAVFALVCTRHNNHLGCCVPSGKLWSASSSDIASAGPAQVLSKGNHGRLRGSLGWFNKGFDKRPLALPVPGSASMPFSPLFSSFPFLL